MEYRNHREHSDRFLDYYKDGFVYLRPSYIHKQKFTKKDGTKKGYRYICEPQVGYRDYKLLTKNMQKWRENTPNVIKLDHMTRDAIPKFVYENCCFCNSDKNIVKHHENYDMWFHFYFMCRSCHIAYHTFDRKDVYLGGE